MHSSPCFQEEYNCDMSYFCRMPFSWDFPFRTNFTDVNGETSAYILQECLFPYGIALALQKNSPFTDRWTGTYLTPLSKPVAGEIPKDREIGTNPLADRMASIVMLFAGGELRTKGCREWTERTVCNVLRVSTQGQCNFAFYWLRGWMGGISDYSM